MKKAPLPTETQRRTFRRQLLKWYDAHGRDLDPFDLEILRVGGDGRHGVVLTESAGEWEMGSRGGV